MLTPKQVAALLRAVEARRAGRESDRLRAQARRAAMDIEALRELNRRHQRAKRERDRTAA